MLNIYNQRDPLVRAYLNGPAAKATSLPDRLVGALRSQCLVLADRAMAAGIESRAGVEGARGARDAWAYRAKMDDPGICRDSIAGLQDQVRRSPNGVPVSVRSGSFVLVSLCSVCESPSRAPFEMLS